MLVLDTWLGCSEPGARGAADAGASDARAVAVVDSELGDVALDAAPPPSELVDPTGVHAPAPLSIPPGAAPSSGWPLVVAFHRYGGSAAEALPRLGLATATAWAVVIAPDGLVDGHQARFFHATDACCDLFQADPDDLAWAQELVRASEAAIPIDPAQVYAVGISNGGFMAEALACADPADIVAAIDASGDPPIACGAPIVLRKIHGTSDTTIAFGSGNFRDQMPADYPAADDPAPYGCAAFATTGATHDYDASVIGIETAEYTATGCASGTEIDLLEDVGGVHIPSWTTAWQVDTTAWLHAHHR